MLDLFGNGLGVLAAAIGLVGLLGGAAGYFKASRGDSIIKYQAIEIESIRRTNADLEKDKIELESEKKALEIACTTKDDTIIELQKHNKYLQKLGQGSPQLKKLTAAITSQTQMLSKFIERGKKNNAIKKTKNA